MYFINNFDKYRYYTAEFNLSLPNHHDFKRVFVTCDILPHIINYNVLEYLHAILFLILQSIMSQNMLV